MESFESSAEEPRPSRKKNPARTWNLLTVLLLVMTLCVIAGTGMLFKNPNLVLNPFPPPTQPVALQLPTDTPTPLVNLPPTWTPTTTPEPSPTATERPTATPEPSETPFYLTTPDIPNPEAGQEKQPTETPSSNMPFALHNDRIIVIENIYHVDEGCQWSGVGGQIFDESGGPIASQIVTLGGYINGKSIPGGVMTTLSGLVPDSPANYYEFQLSEEPFASEGDLWVQLVDQNLVPVSDKVYFDTFADCQKNLIIINFQKVK